MSKKFYITGGAGFIGRHFNTYLKDCSRVNIDIRRQSLVDNQVLGDIRSMDDIKESIGDSDVILHLAASHYDFEKDFYKTNVEGTRNLLAVASENGIKEFIFFSSVAVYGVENLPADEDSETFPENDYGKTKLKAEGLIKQWVEEDDARKALIIRPAVVFGAHNYGNLFNLMRNIDRGRNVQIGKKPVVKSIAYVENLIEATMFLFENVKSNYEVFNYADQPHLTNIEISEKISYGLGKNGVIKIPYSLALILGGFFDVLGNILNKEMVISIKRVKKFCTSTHFASSKVLDFGFSPKCSAEEGLIRTAKWYDKHRDVWQAEYENLKKLFKANFGITIE